MAKVQSIMADQLQNLKQTCSIIRTADPKRQKVGKVALPIARYEQRCLARIAEFNAKMDALPKHSPEWIKLRKQKLAQQSRMRKRCHMSLQSDAVSQIENIIKFALDMSLRVMPADR